MSSLYGIVIALFLSAPQTQAQYDDVPRIVPPSQRISPAKIQPIIEGTEEEPEEVDGEPSPMITHKKERIDPRQGSRYIEHPNAKKGLIKIDKNKVYYYKVTPSEQTKASSVRFSAYEPINLTSPENSDVGYEDIYVKDSWPLITYDQEHQFFKKLGKLGWKWGTGLFIAQGVGQFENPQDQADPPKEEFSLFVFPLNVGLIYRAQFWDTQPIVPYAEVAGGGFAFAEMRDDDKNPGIGAALGFAPMMHFSLGGSIQMGRGPRSFLELDREYGINSFWIDVEYRNYIALGGLDFSNDVLSIGFTAEY